MVVIIVGMTILEGDCEPYILLRAITDDGISWIDAVFITINIHIALLARSGVGFILSRARIASKPNGVAALPIPKRFADIFILIRRIASVFLYFLPKRRLVRGERRRENRLVIPQPSAISIMPDQKHIMGRSVITRSKLFFKPVLSTVTATSPPSAAAIANMPIIIINVHIYVKILNHPVNMNKLKTSCDKMAKDVLIGRNVG